MDRPKIIPLFFRPCEFPLIFKLGKPLGPRHLLEPLHSVKNSRVYHRLGLLQVRLGKTSANPRTYRGEMWARRSECRIGPSRPAPRRQDRKNMVLSALYLHWSNLWWKINVLRKRSRAPSRWSLGHLSPRAIIHATEY